MTLQLTIPSMACSACSDTITRAIEAIDPNVKVNANLKTKVVSIETQAAEAEVKQAITTVGYTVA